jgi:hypothetical protein
VKKVFVLTAALFLYGCASPPKVQYVYIRETPDATFPVFPPPDCVAYEDATDTVSMPLWYWQKIAEYKISVDAVRDYLGGLRALAGAEKQKEPGK